MGTLALLEVLDRDGHVRQQVAASRWPLTAGRALDNDLVLDDPHVAPHHFAVDADEHGQPFLAVRDTVNGLLLGRQKLGRDARVPAADGLTFTAGRTALRLRLAGQPVAAEEPLAATRSLGAQLGTVALLVVVTAAILAFEVYLVTDPGALTRTLGSAAVSAIAMAVGWSGFVALLSKVFSRQGHFLWHVRVMLTAVIAWQLVNAAASALAFVFSWPAVSDFAFVALYAVGGAALYFHLLAIEPKHPPRWRVVGGTAAVVGMALATWFNYQNTDRFGDELYMTHLLPPALRVARPVDADTFLKGLDPLRDTLDEKARKIESDDGGGAVDEE